MATNSTLLLTIPFKTVQVVIEAVAEIVKYFNKSAQATPLHLVKRNRTRWNSIYAMLSHYHKLRNEVKAVLVDRDRTNLLLCAGHTRIVAELIPALQPFDDATVG